NSCWTSTAPSEQGDDPAATSGASAIHPRSPTHRMVHQQSLRKDHRHTDGAPVSNLVYLYGAPTKVSGHPGPEEGRTPAQSPPRSTKRCAAATPRTTTPTPTGSSNASRASPSRWCPDAPTPTST